jgi:hypothetical protein
MCEKKLSYRQCICNSGLLGFCGDGERGGGVLIGCYLCIIAGRRPNRGNF